MRNDRTIQEYWMKGCGFAFNLFLGPLIPNVPSNHFVVVACHLVGCLDSNFDYFLGVKIIWK